MISLIHQVSSRDSQHFRDTHSLCTTLFGNPPSSSCLHSRWSTWSVLDGCEGKHRIGDEELQWVKLCLHERGRHKRFWADSDAAGYLEVSTCQRRHDILLLLRNSGSVVSSFLLHLWTPLLLICLGHLSCIFCKSLSPCHGGLKTNQLFWLISTKKVKVSCSFAAWKIFSLISNHI